MKKLFLIFFFLLSPMVVEAVNRYEVENYFIESSIDENGHLNVKELIVLNGNMESFYKNVYYRNSRYLKKEPYDFTHDGIHNGTKLEKILVSALELKADEIVSFETFQESFQPLKRIYYEEDKTDQEYVESSTQDGKILKLFYEKSFGRIALMFEYTVKDVVVKNLDVSEIYWPYIDSEFQSDIENLSIQISLPKESKENVLKTWVHGDLTSKITQEKNQIITINMKHISKETGINVRLTFDNSVVENVKKTTNLIGFQSILSLEEKTIKEEHETDKRYRKISCIITHFCMIYITIILLWTIVVYFWFDREYKKPIIKDKNHIIKDYSIEVASTLIDGEVSCLAFLASFLNLIYKKNIRISLWHRKNGNYEFVLDNRYNTTHTEDVLLELLFEKMSRNKRFSLNDFSRLAEEKKNVFQKYYNNWVNCVEKDTIRENFYEQNGIPIISSIFLLLISFFLLFANIYFRTNLVIAWIVFLLATLFFLYAMFIKKRSKKGNDHYYAWQKFSKDLDTFQVSDAKDEISLYLIYSVLFQKEKKILDSQKSKNILFDAKFLDSLKKEFQNVIEKMKSL